MSAMLRQIATANKLNGMLSTTSTVNVLRYDNLPAGNGGSLFLATPVHAPHCHAGACFTLMKRLAGLLMSDSELAAAYDCDSSQQHLRAIWTISGALPADLA